MDELLNRPFLELVASSKMDNGIEFCTKYLNNSLNEADVTPGKSLPWQKWGVGLAMVAIISFSSVIGILVLPFLSKKFYQRTLTYFVALGVGTLSASAVFNLIPEAFDLNLFIKDYLTKAWMVICGIYLFYLVDKILAIICDMHERKSVVRPGNAVGDKANGTALNGEQSNQIVLSQMPSNPSGRRLSIESRRSQEHMHIASVAWLVIFGDGLHNFIDGLSIGAAFDKDFLTGISISVAVLCEEVPHELGDCAILLNSGMSYKQALMYNLASASTCFAGFIIGALAGELNKSFAQFIFALAGGMFLYISLAGMLSEINKKAEDEMKRDLRSGVKTMALQSLGLASGLVIIYLFAKFGPYIKFS